MREIGLSGRLTPAIGAKLESAILTARAEGVSAVIIDCQRLRYAGPDGLASIARLLLNDTFARCCWWCHVAPGIRAGIRLAGLEDRWQIASDRADAQALITRRPSLISPSMKAEVA